jgi:hypothetical protein
MVVDRGDHGAKRIENFAAVEIKIYRMGGSERDCCESQSERRDNVARGALGANCPMRPTSTEKRRFVSRQASIRVMISLIALVSAGEMTSKQQSHFGQRQR